MFFFFNDDKICSDRQEVKFFFTTCDESDNLQFSRRGLRADLVLPRHRV